MNIIKSLKITALKNKLNIHKRVAFITVRYNKFSDKIWAGIWENLRMNELFVNEKVVGIRKF